MIFAGRIETSSYMVNLLSGAKLAHAVPGGDYRVIPAPSMAQGARLHQELRYPDYILV